MLTDRLLSREKNVMRWYRFACKPRSGIARMDSGRHPTLGNPEHLGPESCGRVPRRCNRLAA